jgi:ABC-type transport system substrate-binding protein
VFRRGITQRADGAYSRLALQSRISAAETEEEYTRTIYKDIGYYDNWNVGNRKTLYITLLDDQSEEDMQEMAEQYAKAYQYIGINLEREVPIHPEYQAGDVLKIVDAADDEYILEGIITQVAHNIDVAGGKARTVISVDSGGTIDDVGYLLTYTAADVAGDTRHRELIDVIRKAAKNG